LSLGEYRNIYKEFERDDLWYNTKKEFCMQEFFQRYLDKLDVTTVLENVLTKVISLLILFIL